MTPVQPQRPGRMDLDLEEKGKLISQSVSDKGVCRTAPATPGLLITVSVGYSCLYRFFVGFIWFH